MTRSRRLDRTRIAPWACLLVLLGAALAHGPTLAASPDPSSAADRLAASLLTDADLPGFVGRDLDDPAELDIDRLAFDEHRGSRLATRAWVSQEHGVVFDQRMEFPTDEAAVAYLVAAEATLSEAGDAGLALDPDDPLTPATRHWAGEAVIGAEPVAMDVWLIPVGPVVAKVSATVFGPGLVLRRAIAERALARLEAGFGPADAVWPTGTPQITSDPSYSDIEAIQRLMPAVLRTGARGCDGEVLEPRMPGEVAAVSCDRDNAIVVYRQFTDADARDDAYASLLDEVPEPDGTAASCADGAYQGVVTEGDHSWSVACWESGSGLVLLWTEPDQPTLGAILAPPSSDLVALWEEARFRDEVP
ncbi:MAG: hypothetical protein ABWZ82_01660 [Candidatus Limnocylindrales bacterium]